MADHWAGAAAEASALPWTDSSIVEHIDMKAWLIQKRLIAVVKEFSIPHHKEPRQPPAPNVSKLSRELEALGHDIQTAGGLAQCRTCGDSWKHQHRARVVARGPCRGCHPWTQVPPDLHKPWLLPPVQRGIMFQGRVLHYSHRLIWHRGVVYCRHCGYYSAGGRVSDKLVARCTLRCRTSQVPILKRLRQGRPPIRSRGWPLPEQAQCPQDLLPYVARRQG